MYNSLLMTQLAFSAITSELSQTTELSQRHYKSLMCTNFSSRLFRIVFFLFFRCWYCIILTMKVASLFFSWHKFKLIKVRSRFLSTLSTIFIASSTSVYDSQLIVSRFFFKNWHNYTKIFHIRHSSTIQRRSIITLTPITQLAIIIFFLPIARMCFFYFHLLHFHNFFPSKFFHWPFHHLFPFSS